MTKLTTVPSKAISLQSAQAAIQAGVAAANGLGVPMSIVVVDAAGIPVAVSRMDGASVLSYEVAHRKAWTSAVAGAPTAGVHQFISSDAGSLLSMPQVPNFTVVAGGLPFREGDRCVGAVGVSGATAELDLKVAEAAAAALA
jgi:glc operon protein GlcG